MKLPFIIIVDDDEQVLQCHSSRYPESNTGMITG